MHENDITSLQQTAKAGDVQAGLQLAILYFNRGEYANAQEWLEPLVQQDNPQAQNLLGLMYLNGLGVTVDAMRAYALLCTAADHKLREAQYTLACLLFNGIGTVRNMDNARRQLLAAALSGHPAAWRAFGLIYACIPDSADWHLAVRCWQKAALMGDAHSAYLTGLCCAAGYGVTTDIQQAVAWLAVANRAGIVLSARQLTSLRDKLGAQQWQALAAGFSGVMPGPVMPDLPAVNDWPAWRDPAEDIDSSPGQGSVSETPGVLAPFLCDYLVNLAAPMMQPALIVDPVTGKPRKDPARSNSATNLRLASHEIGVGIVCARLAALAGVPVCQAEPLAILNYAPGEEYKPHYDFLSPHKGPPVPEDAAGRRIATTLVYLNQVAEGGGTEFPRQSITVKPETGKAVSFRNYTPEGEPDRSTLHAGLPVQRGEKWLATLWFREKPLPWRVP